MEINQYWQWHGLIAWGLKISEMCKDKEGYVWDGRANLIEVVCTDMHGIIREFMVVPICLQKKKNTLGQDKYIVYIDLLMHS